METGNLESHFTVAWLAIETIIALVIVIHLYYNLGIQRLERRNQKKSFKAVIDAEEIQKQRISSNLHDQVITNLSIAGQKIQLHILTYESHTQVPEGLRKAATLINQGISDIRDITMELIPKTFAQFGLIKAIQLYVSGLNDIDSSETALIDKTSFEGQIPLSEKVQLNIYRICQEILNNLVKHSDYTVLNITAQSKASKLIFTFEHDGKGITNREIEGFRASGKGLGLDSLKSRLSMIDGRIDYQNDLIILTIPLKDEFKN